MLKSVERIAEAELPTDFGRFRAIAYLDPNDQKEHFVLRAEPVGAQPVVRLHSECLTGDTLGSLRCDCGPQLRAAMRLVSEQGGLIVYLRQEGRGIGLVNKIRAYALQDEGMDTLDANLHLGFGADERDYRVASEILKDQGVTSLKLITNNPAKVSGITEHGLVVTERVSLEIDSNPHNASYLKTKRDRMDHVLKNLNGTS